MTYSCTLCNLHVTHQYRLRNHLRSKDHIQAQLKTENKFKCFHCNIIYDGFKNKFYTYQCKKCKYERVNIRRCVNKIKVNKKECERRKKPKNKLSKQLQSYRRRQREKGGNLTDKQRLQLLSDECIYCSEKISYGIDRVVSKMGLYEVGNVLPCCKHCNISKNTLSLREFADHIKKVYKKLNKLGLIKDNI